MSVQCLGWMETAGWFCRRLEKKRDNFCNKEASTFQKLIEIIYLFTYRNLNEYNEKYFLLLITFKTKKKKSHFNTT